MTEQKSTPNLHAILKDIGSLSTYIAQMGGIAEQQLAHAIEAIERRDVDLAEETIRGDREIDVMERDIESSAVRALALMRPGAQDLREVVVAIKVSTDLERVGDLAKNIAKRALVFSAQPPVPVTKSLTRMGRRALAQLKEVLDAYTARAPDMALMVWRRDQELDELYNSLFRELLTYMMEDQRMIGLATHMMFVAKNLERIGDHATNIAENIYYLVNGTYMEDLRPKGDVTSLTRVEIEGNSET